MFERVLHIYNEDRESPHITPSNSKKNASYNTVTLVLPLESILFKLTAMTAILSYIV